MESLVCPRSAPIYYTPTLTWIAVCSIGTNSCGLFVIWKAKLDASYRFCLIYTLTFYAFLVAYLIPSMLTCFGFRLKIAASINKQTSPLLMPIVVAVIAFFHTWPIFVLYLMLNSKLTPAEIKFVLLTKYPECLYAMGLESFEMYDINHFFMRLNYYSTLVAVTVSGSFGMFMAYKILDILKKFQVSMSKQNYQTQLRALISLLAQTASPLILIAFPVVYIGAIVKFDMREWRESANNALFLVCSHSMCSTLSMIYTNETYKRTLKKLIADNAPKWVQTRLKSNTRNVRKVLASVSGSPT